MTKDHLPWFAFYPKDWLADGELRGCSPAARGLWIDLLCLMYGSDERGALISNGRPWTVDRIANSVTGFARDLLDVCLDELEEKHVSSRDDRGALCSRRMLREEDIRQKRENAGRKGGLSRASKAQAKSKQTSDSDSISGSVSKGGVGGNAKRDFWEDAVRAMRGAALNTVDFRAAWEKWIEGRRDRKHTVSLRALNGHIRQCEEMGHDRAIAALLYSDESNYQRLCEPSGAGQRQGARPASRKRAPADRGEYPEPGFGDDG